MTKISISGFLKIKEAHLDIKRVNVLIGPQAQGKSVIAKLIYFFKREFSQAFIQSVKNFDTKRDLQKSCLKTFEQIFPKYAWANQDFEIVYSCGDYEVSLTKSRDKSSPKLDYCKTIEKLHGALKRKYKQAIKQSEDESSEASIPDLDRVFFECVHPHLSKTGFSESFSRTVFIPASRSFFANLQKNVFSFLASNIEIDPFLKEFGSVYERSKRFYGMDYVVNRRTEQKETINKVQSLVESIVLGKYLYEDEKDWIKSGNTVTNLINASSGQQESLPMLLVLSIWPFMLRGQGSTFLIEEPEAHLFPESQKQIVSLLATIANATDNHFFITTHSPYILTALNNLIVGYDALQAQKGDAEKIVELSDAISIDEVIPFEHVSAYTINDGKLSSITDNDLRLIGISLLDEVSDHFENAFDVANRLANQ